MASCESSYALINCFIHATETPEVMLQTQQLLSNELGKL